MRKLLIPVILFFALAQPIMAQNSMTGWEKWQYMMGAWEGEGSGQPGSGSGSYTLKPKLGGCILERKGITDIPAMGGRPAVHHEDVMIVYKNSGGNPVKAIYFDNENHVIPYDITYSDNKIVLVSEANSVMPRFRLTYEKLDDKSMNIRFEMAMPGAPEDFKMYLEGKNRKTKELSEMTP
jgi:hypothetical protein